MSDTHFSQLILLHLITVINSVKRTNYEVLHYEIPFHPPVTSSLLCTLFSDILNLSFSLTREVKLQICKFLIFIYWRFRKGSYALHNFF
jgi:hypothetical protein